MKLSSQTSVKEALPYPYVLYPRGAFVAFSKEEDSPYYLCSCMKEAVKNYLNLRIQGHPGERHLDVWNFPKTFVEEISKSMTTGPETMMDWLVHIPFKEGLCHRCNCKRPTMVFCPPSEGTVFRQRYGWYLDMKHYEFGVVPRLQRYMTNMKRDGLQVLIDYKYTDLLDDMMYNIGMENLNKEDVLKWLSAHDALWDKGTPRVWDPQFPYNFTQALSAELFKQRNRVRRYIEDAIRAEFQFAPLAGKWKSEEKLYKIVEKMLPGYKLKRHFRPKFLDRLELDIYIPELGIGIEYQGIQHYEPVKFFGGKKGLEKVQARDEKKRNLALEADIRIVYFYHYDILTPECVHARLKPYAETALKPIKKFS